MIDTITSLFNGFTVNGVAIPVVFTYYFGHGEPYVTFYESDDDNSFGGDDELEMYVAYYDFNVYARTDYLAIFEELRTRLESIGLRFQPSRSSSMMYETDTRYYHRTYCFAYIQQDSINEQEIIG